VVPVAEGSNPSTHPIKSTTYKKSSIGTVAYL
jgi:hypothetical protein